MYEKVLAAHRAAREHRGLGLDDFLRALLSPEELRTEAYLTYEFLQGRSQAFADFLRGELGFRDDAEAAAVLDARYGDGIRSRWERYRTTGR